MFLYLHIGTSRLCKKFRHSFIQKYLIQSCINQPRLLFTLERYCCSLYNICKYECIIWSFSKIMIKINTFYNNDIINFDLNLKIIVQRQEIFIGGIEPKKRMFCIICFLMNHYDNLFSIYRINKNWSPFGMKLLELDIPWYVFIVNWASLVFIFGMECNKHKFSYPYLFQIQ